MLNFRLLIIFILSFSVMLFANDSYAFGKRGHQIICQLSYQALTPLTKQKVDSLLAELPIKDKRAINKYNKRRINEPVTFAKACTWADAVKKETAYRDFRSWHYVNVERDMTEVNSENSCRRSCLTQAIIFHEKQLKESKDTWKKLTALMFLGHWLGDIHQPLHVGFASDLGGNKANIANSGTCKSMHWYWDDCLLHSNDEDQDQQTAYLTKLYQKAPIKKWQQSTVWNWATESLSLVRSPELKYCQLDKQGKCLPYVEAVTLPDDYRAKFRRIAEFRMLQAAARLTSILENSL